MKHSMLCFPLLFLFHFSFVNAQPGTWTWMKGDSAFLGPANYGTKGVPNANNVPPAMYSPTRWTDLDGNFWFYGGFSSDEFLGDLWKYNPQQNTWTWIMGNGEANKPAIYGIQGVPSPTNFPGCRGWSCASWTDVNGDLWIFGGRGFGNDPAKATQLSDIWRYHIATNEWTWMKGNGDDATNYGIKQVADADNTPGMRQEITANWTDNDGGLWFYGGISNGVLKTGRNDMWRYDIYTNLWTWMSGDTILNVPPQPGITGVFAPANTPGGRMSYCSWQDKAGMFWFFGGHTDLYGGNWCDLWKYNTSINQWAFVSGSTTNFDGLAGNKCDTSKNFFPKGRWENRVRWIDGCGNLWLFGGQRNSGSLNDLWVYSPKADVWSYVNGTLLTNNNGKYGVKGTCDPANFPGSRTGAASWTDKDGNLWLFAGAQTTSHVTFRNDLWKYVPDPACPALACNKVISGQSGNYELSLENINSSWITPLAEITSENKYFDIPLTVGVDKKGWQIYPNPSAGNFTLSFSGQDIAGTVTVTILNALNQIVFSWRENVSGSFEKEIQLQHLPEGVYFVIVESPYTSGFQKLIIRR